jgi:mannose/cellobiose epimerase-like protein (N-acyl-D-glucosamine 2-epimerase family)
LRLLDYELTYHANIDGRWAHLQEGDFWEAVDDEGQPFVEPDGVILSDPGHSLEFVGLAMKFIGAAQAQASAVQVARLEVATAHMITLLGRNFDNGYLPGPQGISKAFDLASRRQLNTDMPWWNLPETIRAAAFCLPVAGNDGERNLCLRVLCDCHNAFREFVRPDLHLMAYQTRDECGLPVASIPATADADPGYHTGLSLLDAIDVIDSL